MQESLDLRALARDLADHHPALRMLVHFGSRARGHQHERSDWDFGFLAAEGLDLLALQAELGLALRTDRVDLADLDRASGLLRFRVARDGVVLFERERGLFERFWMDAVRFWCEAKPVLRAGYESVLERLGP